MLILNKMSICRESNKLLQLIQTLMLFALIQMTNLLSWRAMVCEMYLVTKNVAS